MRSARSRVRHGSAATILICAGLMTACGRQADTGQQPAANQTAGLSGQSGATDQPIAAIGEAQREVTLYFLSTSGRLSPEKRAISQEGSPDLQARRVIEELMKGPAGKLTRVLPIGTGLRSIYLRGDGGAYVDFDIGFSRGLAGGSEDSLNAVWSVTDTIAANFPQVTHVKILIEGEEVRDLGGHLDLSRPLVPDMSLVEDTPTGTGPEV